MTSIYIQIYFKVLYNVFKMAALCNVNSNGSHVAWGIFCCGLVVAQDFET